MEFNFIEEVSKALDTLSVERLVLELPMCSVRCNKCDGKILYTRVQARYSVLQIYLDKGKYMDMYLCPVQEGEFYHLTNLDKHLVKVRSPAHRKEIEEKKADLDKLRVKEHIEVDRVNLVVFNGRFGSAPYPKNLRKKIIDALVIPRNGLRKPRTHKFRRKHKFPKRLPRKRTDRVDLPQRCLMTKMLSWANADKFHTDSEHVGCRPRGDGAKFRRRNRAREAVTVRKMIEKEGVWTSEGSS